MKRLIPFAIHFKRLSVQGVTFESFPNWRSGQPFQDGRVRDYKQRSGPATQSERYSVKLKTVLIGPPPKQEVNQWIGISIFSKEIRCWVDGQIGFLAMKCLASSFQQRTQSLRRNWPSNGNVIWNSWWIISFHISETGKARYRHKFHLSFNHCSTLKFHTVRMALQDFLLFLPDFLLLALWPRPRDIQALIHTI
jgi:hypothetical protein